MDERKQRYPTWQNGLTSSPLMVQGHGTARPSATSRDMESPRKGLDFSGRAVNSHLNRMRTTITGSSQVNIQELLRQASEDFEVQKYSSRYKNGVTGNWMYQRDQHDIGSALYIRGMDTESKVMSTTHTDRPTAVKVIRANIPRADVEEPDTTHQSTNQSKLHFNQSQRNASRTIHRRPSTADAARRTDTPQLSNTIKERKDEPIKLPITAWDTSVNDPDDNEQHQGHPTSPVTDKDSSQAPSPPNILEVNSDDEGFLSNTEEEHKRGTKPRSREADEDVLINGSNYEVKTDQLLKYYIQEEHGDNSSLGEINSHKYNQEQNYHRFKENSPVEHHLAHSDNNNVNIRNMNSGSPDSQTSGPTNSRGSLQSSIIIESPKTTTNTSASDFSNFQNHHLRRSRSPRQSNTFLHRRSHHSPWRTYSGSIPQDVGGLATELRTSYIDITNPLNLRKKPPARPVSTNNSFIGHGLHSYRPRGKGTRSIRVSVSNPDLTSIRVVGTSMSSSNTFRNFPEERNQKFPHSSYSVMS